MAQYAGRRNTHQRESVLKAVGDVGHGTAAEIFGAISQSEPISLGTVYRNLMVLEEEGEILALTGDPGAVHYDRRRDPHYHLFCRTCGKVYDIPLPYTEDLDQQAAQKSGFQIESHSISFTGICQMCQNSSKM